MLRGVITAVTGAALGIGLSFGYKVRDTAFPFSSCRVRLTGATLSFRRLAISSATLRQSIRSKKFPLGRRARLPLYLCATPRSSPSRHPSRRRALHTCKVTLFPCAAPRPLRRHPDPLPHACEIRYNRHHVRTPALFSLLRCAVASLCASDTLRAT